MLLHKIVAALLLGIMAVAGEAATAGGCGDLQRACETPLGDYHIARPAVATAAPYPVLLFFHGGGQSGAMVLQRNAGWLQEFTRRGYLVVLPNGLKRPDSRFGPGWSFHPERPAMRDEAAFARELIADAAARHRGDPDRVLMSGYSIGGSLTWYLACQDAKIARGFAPVAGGFWRPLPAGCSVPVDLLHTHGWTDQTVPLAGRPLRSGEIYQGDIHAGLAIWRAVNGCHKLRADRFDTQGYFWHRVWDDCDAPQKLEFALHPGGHHVPDGWAAIAIDWFETLP